MGDDHLERARYLLERAIRARAADGAQEIERLMRPPAAAELIGDHAYDRASPIGDLVARLGLQPTEADLFAVLLACETDPASARLATQLAANPNASAMTVDTLFEIAMDERRGLGQ
jgi:hypothetical protein